MIVPNYFPPSTGVKKLALVGEAPGADEERLGRPFVGASGSFLAKLLSRAGMSIESCFLGNVCQHRPPNNDLSQFAWHDEEIQGGLMQLNADLEKFKPNIVMLLGNVPLKAAKDPYSNGPLKACKFKNSDWRGSLFKPNKGPLDSFKCICSYHPAYVLRDYDAAPFLQLDLRKAVRQSENPNLILPTRNIEIPTTVAEATTKLLAIRRMKPRTGTDIEGYWNNLKCIGFAPSRDYALVIPFKRQDGSRYWSREDEPVIWRAVANFLADWNVPKVFMAGLYDTFCLEYGHGLTVNNYAEDIMAKHWALYSELAKDEGKKKGIKGMGLAVQASIYTDEPHYKDEYDSDDDDTFFRYNGKDCCLTIEICQTLEQILDGPGESGFRKEELVSMKAHYKFNMALHSPFRYLIRRGMNYDSVKAASRRAVLATKKYELQAQLNAITGYGFKWKSRHEINDRVRQLMLTKRGDRVYKQHEQAYERTQVLLGLHKPNLATIGELEDLCEVSLNLESSKQTIAYLYETLKLPIQYTNKRNEDPRPTADYEALLKLSRICQQEKQYEPFLPIIHLAIQLRSLSTREGMLGISADRDGRIRCGYNIVGTNTGRISCYESPTGSGYNLQTIPNYTNRTEAPGEVLGDRDLFLADEDHWFFQCDLAGADGWTVAAYCAMLGDTSMLDDYRAEIKPFDRLCLKVLGIPAPKDRQECREVVRQHVKKDSWERFACKRVQHGGAYLEGALTVSRNILKDSEGKLFMSVKECQQLLDLYLVELYWGIKRWHDWVARRIRERPILTAASGQVRQFFGRPDDVLTKAVAFEPQANTTYATNLAMFKLWTDPANRTEVPVHGSSKTGRLALRVEPLHQVHDALCGQFQKADTTWAVGKIKQWFANELTIAGQKITIPYDGAFGSSWGQLDEGKL